MSSNDLTDPSASGIAELRAVLSDAGLIDADADFTALTGGVASDIWRVDSRGRTFVVKRALPKLRVAAEWYAPVNRNVSEAAWMRVAKTIVPEAVPNIIFEDAKAAVFAMTYFPSDAFPVWKNELRNGRVDFGLVDSVGCNLAAIHSATAHNVPLATQFANDSDFRSLRLEPYLEATAAKHPDIAGELHTLLRDTLSRHIALVHGDVSPKNILVGRSGPIFLDAECAVYGDPAFDVAFCLSHLLLKCLWNPTATSRFLDGFGRLCTAYLSRCDFAGSNEIEVRSAALIPALLLARIDGKSPVEYVTRDRDRELVRRAMRPLIKDAPRTLSAVRQVWLESLKCQ
jgi:aminoglycoside phosphotransferase (APT) family kinase protein